MADDDFSTDPYDPDHPEYLNVDPVQAAEDLLNEVASKLYSAVKLIDACMQEPDNPADHLVALQALLSQVGEMAGRGGGARTGYAWHSRAAARNLAALEHLRRKGLPVAAA